MEALRDLALAEYENLPDEGKILLHDRFKEYIADGSDFSEYFGNRTIPVQRVHDMMAYREKRLDFEEFITLTYVDANAEAVIISEGCSSLITGRPYFICKDCFYDHSNSRSFNLCCDCYRSRNFEDHEHTSFFANHRVQRGSRGQRAWQEYALERRNEFIDRAMMEFSKDFIKFARSVTTDNGWENRFGALLNIDKDKKLDEMSPRMKKELQGETSAEKEEKNSTMSRPKPQNNRNIDLLGAKASGRA